MSGDSTCQKDVLVLLVQDVVHAWPFTYIDLPEPQSFHENRKVIHQCRAASRGTSENAEGTSCQGALGSGSRSCLRSTVNTSAVCETRMPERARPALWREAGELGRYGGARDGKEAEALEASKFYKDKKK